MAASISGAGSSGSSNKNRKVPSVAQTHDDSKSIRAQSKKDKAAGPAGTKQTPADRAGMSKEVVKAVLASPLTTPWPNIPRHLQTATLHALGELIPKEVAEYHVSRARCHQKEKRQRRRQERRMDVLVSAEGVKDEVGGEDELNAPMKSVGEKRKSSGVPDQLKIKKPRTDLDEPRKGIRREELEPGRPERAQILDHMVLGINEVIKALETQIDDLKLQLIMMGDALNGQTPGQNGKGQGPMRKADLIPTAPRSPSSSPEPEPTPELKSERKDGPIASASVSAPLEYIVVPLLSINPPSLVTPIPQYCATYNALVYQHTQLARICKTRQKAGQLDSLLGPDREECRVVPLGAVELEMAQLVGLRRLACLGIRNTHPAVDILRKLLPKSILHAPRHAITLPFPSSSLRVHSGADQLIAQSTNGNAAFDKPKTAAPIPDVHYADLHIKGIQTKIPVDNNARKAKRLEEVRAKRVEAKLKKKAGRGKGNAKR
ncbi:hypothetical protein IAU60_000414 [Kwoniella sp. DSM 27419]